MEKDIFQESLLKHINELLITAKYKFAKTMPNIPHSYTMRQDWNDKQFVDVVIFIRENGIEEKFGNKSYIYYYLDGFKYWTMGNPVCYHDKKKTYIINRARVC